MRPSEWCPTTRRKPPYESRSSLSSRARSALTHKHIHSPTHSLTLSLSHVPHPSEQGTAYKVLLTFTWPYFGLDCLMHAILDLQRGGNPRASLARRSARAPGLHSPRHSVSHSLTHSIAHSSTLSLLHTRTASERTGNYFYYGLLSESQGQNPALTVLNGTRS